ncbi:MAG: hypothetical protein NTY99_03225 [DPANN group archaeon]|nr:hypothetical protein [DPANN group archaeon]
MMNNRGQTWIEFIITTVVFLFVIAYLFMGVTGQAKTEIEKVNLQTACLKANGLADVLFQPGMPANWESGNNVTVFGLSNSNRTAISLNKWLKAKEFGFVNISANTTPSSPWRINYKIYAFTPGNDANCKFGNGITICRRASGLNITANSTSQSTTKLILFFPFSTAAIGGTTTETDDYTNTTSGNGTTLSLLLHTNSTDEDFVDVSFAPNPNLIFIDSIEITSPQNITLLLGNKSAIDSFGALTIFQKDMCSSQIKGQIDLGNDTALANMELQAW